jgi:hypothetical protein
MFPSESVLKSCHVIGWTRDFLNMCEESKYVGRAYNIQQRVVLMMKYIKNMHLRDFSLVFLYCGLVVRVLGYRFGGPGSIPGTTKKKSSGPGTGSTQPREYI